MGHKGNRNVEEWAWGDSSSCLLCSLECSAAFQMGSPIQLRCTIIYFPDHIRNVLPEHVTVRCSSACLDSSEEAVIQSALALLSLSIERGWGSSLWSTQTHLGPFPEHHPRAGWLLWADQVWTHHESLWHAKPRINYCKRQLVWTLSAKLECVQKLQPWLSWSFCWCCGL